MSRKEIDLDLSDLYNLVQKDKVASLTRLKFAEFKDNFEKVAFDLYKDQNNVIWKLEVDADSGEEFIIRTAETSNQFWSTELSLDKNTINLIYKGTAIRAFKKAELNYDDENVEEWRSFLIEKIQTDPKFLDQVCANIGQNRKQVLAKIHPELFKK